MKGKNFKLAKYREMDLTTGNLFKKLILFSFPIILTSILQLLYTQADLIVLRLYGEGNSSVSAVGVNGSLINLIVGLFLGLAIGCNVVLAQAKGRNDKEYADKVLHSSILLALIFGTIVAVFGAIFAKNFLHLLNVTDDVIDKAATYLTIYFIGMPFSLLYNYGASLQRGLGNSIRPLVTLIITGFINVGLNFIFVIPLKMDVAGVALATVLSMVCSAIITLVELYVDKSAFVSLNFKKLKLDKKASFEIIKIGLPAGLQSIVFSISNVGIQAEANLFGSASEIGNTAASNIENYLYLYLNSVAVGCAAFVAQNYGSKNYENIRKSIFYAGLIQIVSGLAFGAILYLLREPLLNLFINNSPEGYKIGEDRLTLLLFTYFICGVMDVFSQTYRSEKYTFTPLIATFLGCLVIRLLFINTLFKLEYFHTLVWLYSVYPISWVITVGIYLSIYIPIQRRIKVKLSENKQALE